MLTGHEKSITGGICRSRQRHAHIEKAGKKFPALFLYLA